MVPQTWLQVLVILAAVVPGFVYQISRRRVAGPGPDETAVSIRVLRAIASSAVFGCAYGILLGPEIAALLRTPDDVVANPRAVSAAALVLVLGVPWIAARLSFYITTASWWTASQAWLIAQLGLRRQWDPTPSAWDFAFGSRGPGWIRLLTTEGQWIGGYFGYDSFASSHPDSHDIFIEVGYAMTQDGKFRDDVSAPGGVFVRCDDIRMVDFLPEAASEAGQDGGSRE